jgi:16S rRNA (uracil1498-N3)-methyltransferase
MIMHEKATRPIHECVVPSQGHVVIVIGPEGGLTDEEVTSFEQAGGQTYLMGPTVLRTSTAAAIAVTQVRLLAAISTREASR